MRKPLYLSHSSVTAFYKDRQEFYLRYLAENRPPRFPQTQPMSVGSAFDAYTKSYMVECLFGRGTRPQFDFETIFESQVEEHNREWARQHGKYVFDEYKKSGALADLMQELQKAKIEPRFELKIEGRMKHDSCIEGVPMVGIPDVYFFTAAGLPVILDWKVNGYCGKNLTSPKPGYIILRPGGTQHKSCMAMNVNGFVINVNTTLDVIDESWASQLSIYAWLLGEPIGSKFVAAIDQICGGGSVGTLRVASHRVRVNSDFQSRTALAIVEAWKIIQSGHIFPELSPEDNAQKCSQLDEYYKAFEGQTDKDIWFTDALRGG